MRFAIPMTARDPDQEHRAVTSLELFFDLTFVAAVAQGSSSFHHELVAGDAGNALLTYPIVFFAIWWAWMNFSWFASAYDTDDAAYRVAVLVQMAGVLIFAAGIPRFFEDLHPVVGVSGYLIMRVGLISLWLRAAKADTEGRSVCLRYAAGVLVCETAWVVLLAVPGDWWLPCAAVLIAAELAVPPWAEHENATAWHPGHIGERYALFTIIVLGESILAATVAVQVALDAGSPFSDLVTVALGGFLIVAAMWWTYFDQPVERVLARARQAHTDHNGRRAFAWGYGHYVVFASAAATGAGIAVAVDEVTHQSALTRLEAAFAVTVPVAVYLLAVWALHAQSKDPGPLRTFAAPVTAALVLATSWTGEPVLFTGIVLVTMLLVAMTLYHHQLGMQRRPQQP
jgi:low temperature requirement protein LtrA